MPDEKNTAPAIRVFKLFLHVFRKVGNSAKQREREREEVRQLQTHLFVHFGTETRGAIDIQTSAPSAGAFSLELGNQAPGWMNVQESKRTVRVQFR
jgi:hypothetical protein